MPYNNTHIDEPVNIIECDIYLKPEPSKNVVEVEEPQQEEGDYINTADYINMRQIEREVNAVPHMDLVFIPETQTLTSNGWYFKRGHEEEDAEEPQAKRMRGDSYDYEISRMEEGLVEVERLAEEANFDAMIAYMTQQVHLAQQLAEDELYPCDCLDCRK